MIMAAPVFQYNSGILDLRRWVSAGNFRTDRAETPQPALPGGARVSGNQPQSPIAGTSATQIRANTAQVQTAKQLLT